MNRRSIWQRMWGAATLHADTYEEVEADPPAIRQALAIVVFAAATGALGSWLLHSLHRGFPPEVAAIPILVELLEPLVLWLGGSFFAYTVGATFFRGPHTETDFPEVLRTVGFAFSPAWIRIVGFALPGVQAELGLPASEIPRIVLNTGIEVWVLVAGIVAVRQALDFTTVRAIATYGSASFLLYLVVNGLSFLLPA